MPGVSRWVWLAARTSFVPNQIGKKNLFWSWVVGGLQNLLELVEFSETVTIIVEFLAEDFLHEIHFQSQLQICRGIVGCEIETVDHVVLQ